MSRTEAVFANRSEPYGMAQSMSTKAIARELEAARIELVEPELKVPFVPDGDDLRQCTALGKTIAQKINAS